MTNPEKSSDFLEVWVKTSHRFAAQEDLAQNSDIWAQQALSLVSNERLFLFILLNIYLSTAEEMMQGFWQSWLMIHSVACYQEPAHVASNIPWPCPCLGAQPSIGAMQLPSPISSHLKLPLQGDVPLLLPGLGQTSQFHVIKTSVLVLKSVC